MKRTLSLQQDNLLIKYVSKAAVYKWCCFLLTYQTAQTVTVCFYVQDLLHIDVNMVTESQQLWNFTNKCKN